MMDILMSETCWTHKKWNKIANDIKSVFYSSRTTYFSHKHKYTYWSVTITIGPPYQSGMMADFTDRNMLLYLNKENKWMCLTDTQRVAMNVLQTTGCSMLNNLHAYVSFVTIWLVLHNILHDFGIPMKLVRLIKIKICRTIILPVVLYGCETWLLTLR